MYILGDDKYLFLPFKSWTLKWFYLIITTNMRVMYLNFKLLLFFLCFKIYFKCNLLYFSLKVDGSLKVRFLLFFFCHFCKEFRSCLLLLNTSTTIPNYDVTLKRTWEVTSFTSNLFIYCEIHTTQKIRITFPIFCYGFDIN